ncbi:DUF4350 domain-containing protein [Flavobacterium sp. ASW18X]|uniref:DUF4350 domain-containing protein n=1 Tax=Flavobacterium sp. ASW18X TaxID=2572595 RepID=UPI0010AE3C39|nr:DUF4350 domain-containing protein [Flavobacterium sp. ASW18X]TKD57493.1 DUF4350 domain-containing protein [Flavobacterium sp. ASW18X]
MDKRSKIIIGLFFAVFLGIIITEIVKPRPLNWRPSYTQTDKIPFGCHILFKELGTLFPDSEIETVEESVYDFIYNLPEDYATSNYMLINGHVSLDQQETNKLLEYVAKGNTVFLAANSFSYFLADTLNITVESDYGLQEDTVKVSLTHPKFKKPFYFSRGYDKSHFTSVDTANTTVLGYVDYKTEDYLDVNKHNEHHEVNFIKTTFGKGAFYINTIPQAYTNYYLKQGNKDYIAQTFSYLKDDKLYWDNFKKAGRKVVSSPLRFVLNEEALKWAYYLVVSGLLLFMIFKAKREQRIIPIITPKENTSVSFARTVGALYYQNKDYTNLIQKKLNYFLAHLRSRYFMDTTVLDHKSIMVLSGKSGKSKEEIKELIDYINYLNKKTMHSEDDLVALNKKLTAFKQ